MTKLLEEAIATVREFPDDMQDTAAEALMWFLSEMTAELS
jgi:hypothetical protein